jgi:Na+/proline symporter
MVWKKWAIWYRGAIIGLIVGLIVSIGITKENGLLSSLASPGLLSCRVLTQCYGSLCTPCLIVGLLLNLIYGFVIGAIIGLIIQKITKKEKVEKKVTKNKRRKK